MKGRVTRKDREDHSMVVDDCEGLISEQRQRDQQQATSMTVARQEVAMS